MECDDFLNKGTWGEFLKEEAKRANKPWESFGMTEREWRSACNEVTNGYKPLEKVGSDPVNHPDHYKSSKSGIECIQITEHMNFCLGNAVKYIWRAGLKSASPVEDLKKAVWYLNREIARLENETKTTP